MTPSDVHAIADVVAGEVVRRLRNNVLAGAVAILVGFSVGTVAADLTVAIIKAIKGEEAQESNP